MPNQYTNKCVAYCVTGKRCSRKKMIGADGYCWQHCQQVETVSNLLMDVKIEDQPPSPSPVSVFEDPKYKKPVDEDEWWKKPRVKQENVVVTPEDWASLTMRSKKLMI